MGILYEKGRSAKRRLAAQKQHDELEALKTQEKAKYDQLTRYATLTGRDKRIAMLTAAQAEAEAEARRMRDAGTGLYQASQQKEHDWATHGGIAAGIAGGAAGVATAINIQAKNAQIRAQNAANAQAMAPVLLATRQAAVNAQKQAEHYQAQIQQTKVKLIADTPAQQAAARVELTGEAYRRMLQNGILTQEEFRTWQQRTGE